VNQYPNHYLKTGHATSYSACVAQCNADTQCTHIEWGVNGHWQKQCVIFSPKTQQCVVPTGWTFVHGNGGAAITQGNRWPGVQGPPKCSAKVPIYRVIGTGSCRSDNVNQYPNHYLKTGHATSYSACVAQCNADTQCTHIEWGVNGHWQKQCVIFSPKTHQGVVPAGWTFVHGNGGAAIAQGNRWPGVQGPPKCSAKITGPSTYHVLGDGSCRSTDISKYPNHYLKIGHVTRSECEAQCNADIGCTHMEWGLNGHHRKQCVVFSPQRHQGCVPAGWTFVPGNGGTSVTRANRWSHVSKCFTKV